MPNHSRKIPFSQHAVCRMSHRYGLDPIMAAAALQQLRRTARPVLPERSLFAGTADIEGETREIKFAKRDGRITTVYPPKQRGIS